MKIAIEVLGENKTTFVQRPASSHLKHYYQTVFRLFTKKKQSAEEETKTEKKKTFPTNLSTPACSKKPDKPPHSPNAPCTASSAVCVIGQVLLALFILCGRNSTSLSRRAIPISSSIAA
jgi:hypothetical protein